MKDNSKINIIIYIFLISSVSALNRKYNPFLKESIAKAKSKNLSIENEKPKIEDYDLIYEEKSEFLNSEVWTIREAGPSAWNKHAGLKPQFMETKEDGKFIRLSCDKTNSNEDGWITSAISTKETYGDGMFECEARFKSGKSTWPAIWMVNNHVSKDNSDYYEIDLSEYYETRDTTETTYHNPQSIIGGDPCAKTVSSPIKKGDWNKFICTWDKNYISVYLNDQKIFEVPNDGDASHYPTIESTRFFTIILSMQYANKWLSTPDLSELPLYMDIRKLKIYKLKK